MSIINSSPITEKIAEEITDLPIDAAKSSLKLAASHEKASPLYQASIHRLPPGHRGQYSDCSSARSGRAGDLEPK